MPNRNDIASERAKVGMLVPPPLLLLGLILVCVLIHALWLPWPPFLPLRAIAGGVLLLAGLALSVSSARLFQKAGTPVRPVAPTTSIVQTGAYRFSRNPIYLGMAAGLAGLAVLTGSYAFGLAVIVFVVVVDLGVVRPEERYLDAVQGEEYRQYKRRVRRWL